MTKSITVARQQASNFAEKKYTVGLGVVTENSVRAENAEVPGIHEILMVSR
jgi:hypothetical protein